MFFIINFIFFNYLYNIDVYITIFYLFGYFMDQINIKLDLILNKLESLEKKIEQIDKKVNECEKSCQNMDEHIHFVNHTYTSLRAPLEYVRTKVNMLTGQNSSSMPQITNK